MADEVYQQNVYNKQKPFISFRKVLKSMGNEYNDVELISFNSISKGIFGECGLRGGYMELTNIEDEGWDQLYKLHSFELHLNSIAQIVIEVMCDPPKVGDESYDLYCREYNTHYESLRKRALLITQKLNTIEGITCQTVSGSMFAFPKINIPPKAINAAKKQNTTPDTFYCLQLLENKGICLAPGSTFHQKNDSFYFCATILPPENELEYCIHHIADFHNKFLTKFA